MHSLMLHRTYRPTLFRLITIATVVIALGMLIILQGRPQSATAETAPEASAENTVQVQNDFFSPNSITIEVGETVTWERVEGFHNVQADDGSFGNELGDVWLAYNHTFTEPGTYSYYCEAHGGPGGVGMAGVVIVTEPATPEDHEVHLPMVMTQ